MLRVVLYAEGAGEMLGSITLLPPPGQPLSEPMLGPAHVLVRRAIERARGIHRDEVRFEAPLRVPPGRLPRGSDLLSKAQLTKLMSWPRPGSAPDLAIVLVDADGDKQRKRKLEAAIQNAPVSHVVAVAIQEFEAWLVADHAAVAGIIGRSVGFERPPSHPEKLPPRDAKYQLSLWLGEASGQDDGALRRQLADGCDLGLLSKRCRAFSRFLSELSAIDL